MRISKTTELKLKSLVNQGIGRRLSRATSPDDLTLEVGCGPGQYRYAVNGDYIGLDITMDDYAAGLPRVLTLVADGTALPFRPASFDLLFFSNLFTHFHDQTTVLKKATLLVKPGGAILIFDYSPVTLAKLAQKYAITNEQTKLFSRTAEEWITLFKDCGLRDVSIEINAAIWKRIPAKVIAAIGGEKHLYSWINSHSAAICIYGKKV